MIMFALAGTLCVKMLVLGYKLKVLQSSIVKRRIRMYASGMASHMRVIAQSTR